jgi:hypothetical protein
MSLVTLHICDMRLDNSFSVSKHKNRAFFVVILNQVAITVCSEGFRLAMRKAGTSDGKKKEGLCSLQYATVCLLHVLQELVWGA